jgi:L-ascorbate metabolism protein UlaG (beta-lactamase superfamily)
MARGKMKTRIAPSLSRSTPALTFAPEVRLLSIRYLGYSSFLLTAFDGSAVVTDPYGAYPPFLEFPKGIRADLVTISHDHADHNDYRKVAGDPVVVRQAVATAVGGVRITGYPSLHGDGMGPNIIFVFEYGGVKVVHLGELGEIENEHIYEAISGADVMLVPISIVGATPYDRLIGLIERTGARTVVPQHFSLSAEERWYGMRTVDEFLAAVPADWPMERFDELDAAPGMPRRIAVLKNLGLPAG